MSRLLQYPLVQRFWDLAGGVSIRVKVLGIVLGVIILLSTFVIVQMRNVLTETLLDVLVEQGIAISESIEHDLYDLRLLDDHAALQRYLNERHEHYSSDSHSTVVAYIRLENAADRSLIGASQLGTEHNETAARVDLPMPGSPQVFVDDEIVEIATAFLGADALLRLGLSRSSIQAIVSSVTLQLLAIILVMVAVGFAAAFFLTWIVTRPLLDLVAATHAVAAGDFSRRVLRWANDEIGELSTAFNRMTASLEQASREQFERAELRERYVSGVILAQESERQRIARELHDSTSQSLTSLLVGLQNLKTVEGEDQLNAQIEGLRTIVSQTLDEVRTLSWRLRPSALDDLGLLVALQNYIADFQSRHQIQVDYAVRGIDARLPPEMETSIYRIVQEGLTNVARYAKASHVSVFLHRRGNMIRLIVEDNGVGFDPDALSTTNKSLGLQGIRERAGLFGGTLTLESLPNQGTSLFIEIPYQEGGASAHHYVAQDVNE